MGLLDWLFRANKNNADGKESAPLAFEKNEEEFHGLNMKSAIDAHLKWKERLENELIRSSGEQLDVRRVAGDTHCELGRWLHGEGKRRFSEVQEYKDLIKSHVEFHLFAGELLATIRAGDTEVAQNRLRSEFRRKSDRVQLDLVRLYAAIHRGG